MTKVVNIRHEPYDILIDRSTKWGNPYIEGKDGTRREVIEKFIINILPILWPDIHELVDKIIGCHCKPKPCHGDPLALAANIWQRGGEIAKHLSRMMEEWDDRRNIC